MPQPSDPFDVDLAACRTLLRGGSKSFDLAAKFLPRAVRDPAVALYAFCREADDLIDEECGGLDRLRERLARAYDGRPFEIPADRAFAAVVARFAIPRTLPEALLEGFAWDNAGRRYHNLPQLRAYAARVAGSVGAMMAVVMGVRDAERLAAAVDLGVAMQLSNIARDVGEDARNGRLYLPLDWLQQAGVDPDTFLLQPAYSAGLGQVVARLLDAADQHYRAASPGIARLPVACRFGIAAAAILYCQIGQQVRRCGFNSVSTRAVVPSSRKITALATGLAGMSLPLRPLSGSCTPEGAYLIQAVASVTKRPVVASTPLPWWDVAERARWTIDLFERLESRERVQP